MTDGKNTLAYYSAEIITAVNIFIAKVPGRGCYKVIKIEMNFLCQYQQMGGGKILGPVNKYSLRNKNKQIMAGQCCKTFLVRH